MDKIKDSLTFLFKEKYWAVKMAIPFALTLLFTFPSILSDSNTQTYNNAMIYSNLNTTNLGFFGLLFLLACCLMTIPFGLITSWYTYESTQSGIQKRQTKAIWEGNFGDKLKKSLKYAAASLIYGFAFGIIILGLVIVFVAIATVLTRGSVGYMGTDPSRILNNAEPAIALLICMLACVAAIFLIALSVLAYLVITPAMLRLVATNTFGEAFRVKDNWNLAMKYKGEFLGLFLVNFTAALLVGVLGFVMGFFTTVGSLIHPIFYVVASFLVSYVTSLITTYFSYFFYPRFSGLVFRDIVNKESSLSYVTLEEKAK